MGFSCGHVFHLSCLLEAAEGADQAMIETRPPPTDEAQYTRSVKAKVQHAQEIKRAVKGGGCPVCVLPEGAAG